jgi:hypothetical protein
MSSNEADDDATGPRPSSPPVGPPSKLPDRWQLMICRDDGFTTHDLSDSGPVTIGRSSGCQVVIDHPSVSRVHATLSLGPRIVLADNHSRNGTVVEGEKLEPRAQKVVAPGELIQFGAVMAVIQKLSSPRAPRTLLTHGYFEARVQEERARCTRRGGSFVLLRVSFDKAPAVQTEAVLLETLRAHDVVAQYAPSEYEILLDADPAALSGLLERVRTVARLQGLSARAGFARYPQDGSSVDDLLGAANAAVRGNADGPITVEAGDMSDSPMGGLSELVARVARSSISVLILGETGAGKGFLAEAIHHQSPRADRPFLQLSCAAMPETLLENELFGHERGAFTGAVANKRGLLETAEGGTVFLDEVGELPFTTQGKLLQVVEQRMVMRLGALVGRPIDVRFVSATNRDLEAEVERGTFRRDLFFRLNGVTLVVPPLRERKKEIVRLARSFAARPQPRPRFGPSKPTLLSPGSDHHRGVGRHVRFSNSAQASRRRRSAASGLSGMAE